MRFVVRTTLADRVRDRLRWWRYTLPFQLAHGPLCRRHRANAIRLGRLWLCRSCAWLYGTALATLVLGLLGWLPWAFWPFAVPVLLLSFPPLYRSFPRWAKDGLRAGAGALLGGGTAWACVGSWWQGLLAVMLLGAVLVLYRPFRMRQRVTICDGCRELERDVICSGYRRQALRLRHFEESASSALTARFGSAGR